MEEILKDYYDKETYEHVVRVSSFFEKGSDEYYLSLLHDILEDTFITEYKLCCLLLIIGKVSLLKEVKCISRTVDETYFEYIKRINSCGNGLCKKVKIADLKSNLSLKETLKESLEIRYNKALKILLGDD